MTGVRLVTTVDVRQPRFGGLGDPPVRTPSPVGRRRANLGAGFVQTSIYHGPDLQPGDTVAAPAIVEERFTTIVVYPGWVARVDGSGDYVLDRVEPNAPSEA
jgi:N-methylhydantoinase A